MTPPGTINDGFDNCTNCTSITDLNILNDVYAKQHIFIMVYVAILMIVGILGNVLVLYVFYWRFKKTSSNYFILSMAVFDLISCLVAMPTEIYDLCFPFTFYSSIGCKIFRYAESVVAFGSVFILIGIAVDRYLKICHPLKMVAISRIKCMCIVVGIVAVFMALPTLFLFGIARTKTPVAGLEGYDCSIEEEYKKTFFPKIYYVVLSLLFVATFIVLTGLYVRIWIEIRRRKHTVIGDQVHATRKDRLGSKDDSTHEQTGSHDNKPVRVKIQYVPSISDDGEPGRRSVSYQGLRQHSFSSSIRPRLQSIAEVIHKVKVSRSTVIFFIVTVAFIVSYLPAIVVMVCRSTIKGLDERQTSAEKVLSKLFSKFFLINNAINPVIYSFLNVNFRNQCTSAMRKICCCSTMKCLPPRERKISSASQKSHSSAGSDKSSKPSFHHGASKQTSIESTVS